MLLAAASGVDPADEHLATALTVLLDDNEALTRSLLGVGSGGPGSFPEFGPVGF